MKQRMCNKYGCAGVMRPTRKMWDLDGEVKNPTHRMFRCSVCGNENPWLDKPHLNGQYGELHMMKDGCASGLSMSSDPIMYPPKNPLLNRRRRR
jgi:hypothetical protein